MKILHRDSREEMHLSRAEVSFRPVSYGFVSQQRLVEATQAPEKSSSARAMEGMDGAEQVSGMRHLVNSRMNGVRNGIFSCDTEPVILSLKSFILRYHLSRALCVEHIWSRIALIFSIHDPSPVSWCR